MPNERVTIYYTCNKRMNNNRRVTKWDFRLIAVNNSNIMMENLVNCLAMELNWT
ncbi:UNVERIFIED_CONTAM: hypothetical protein ABIC26_005099 [Paenibacillus sp. PvR008]